MSMQIDARRSVAAPALRLDRAGRERGRFAGSRCFHAILVERLANLLARLEHRHALGRDRDALSGARIAPDARATFLGREGAEAPDLDAIAVGKRIRDRIEHGIDRGLRIALIETR